MQSPIYKVHDALSNSYNIVDNLNLKIEISNGSSNNMQSENLQKFAGQTKWVKTF